MTKQKKTLFKKILDIIFRRENYNKNKIMGEDISGKWINTRTGQVVTARQIINDGDIAMVVTDAGLIPMNEFSNYVQMSDEEVGKLSNANIQMNDNNITDEDKALIGSFGKEKQPEFDLNKPLPSTKKLATPEKSQVEELNKSTIIVETESTNYKLINKVFTKFGSPELSISINWNDFPKEQLNNLVNIFDVPIDEIAEYIAKNLLNIENIKETIKKELN